MGTSSNNQQIIQGNTYTYQQIENLWVQNGGSTATAAVAASYAMAESGGWAGNINPADTNGLPSVGLFQINAVNGAGATTDVNTNIKTAIALSNNGTDWHLWGTKPVSEKGDGAAAQFYNPSVQPTATPGGPIITAPGTGTGQMPSQDVIKRAQGVGAYANVQGQGNISDITPPTAQTYRPLNNYASNIDLSTLVAPIVITEGLNAKPWYNDSSLITGNPRLRKEVQPVTFQVLLHDNQNFLLSSKGETGDPIKVELNASMKSMTWSMKHIYYHQRARTSHHVTMWGMQADLIEGQCTTGVFMNQFGLTDYYSTRTINDNLKTMVGMMLSNLPSDGTTNNSSSSLSGNNSLDLSAFNNLTTVNGPNGQSVTTVSGNPTFSAVMNSATRSNPNFKQSSAFRVAAQDAFMEFLALFKMNGNVWFWNKLYQSNVGETRDWTQIEAWSPVLGMSTAQKNARNNDVLTRGGVIMNYRNFVYQGYFKTLQWTMDANNPYLWNFNFIFQVERTIGQQFIPDR